MSYEENMYKVNQYKSAFISVLKKQSIKYVKRKISVN